jgi:hypothetical protein
MTLDAVEQIVRATLYEGYMLYPYRQTSVKNQQRWNFGVVYPQTYSEAQRGSDPWQMQTECLLQTTPAATLEVRVRFLHLIQRQTGSLKTPWVADSAIADTDSNTLEGLELKGPTWQEAFEQEVAAPVFNIMDLVDKTQRVPFRFPAKRTVEPSHNDTAALPETDVVVRVQECVAGEVEISARQNGDLIKVTVAIVNRTPFTNATSSTRNEALLRSLVSAHTILRARAAEFVSLLDPPDKFRDAAAGCTNAGTWPVLVGAEGTKDTMLSSPIILYDYPQIAAESAGDLFDGTEIDEILTLRIMTLTDAEKREMRESDERAKKILERTEMLPAEQLMKMHGAVRGLKAVKSKN